MRFEVVFLWSYGQIYPKILQRLHIKFTYLTQIVDTSPHYPTLFVQYKFCFLDLVVDLMNIIKYILFMSQKLMNTLNKTKQIRLQKIIKKTKIILLSVKSTFDKVSNQFTSTSISNGLPMLFLIQANYELCNGVYNYVKPSGMYSVAPRHQIIAKSKLRARSMQVAY